MTQGFGLLFALFIGVPVWFWGQSALPVAGRGADIAMSFLLVTGLCYVIGWVFGFSIKKIRGG